jgi:endo-1,4-beta-xylanase
VSNIATGFETNTGEGWSARIGPETVTVSSADKHTGTYSLLTTNRQAAFHGCKINVTDAMANGSRYRVSVWAKLAPGATATNLRVSLERTLGANTTFHTVVPNTSVTSGAWVRLSTDYNYTLNHNALRLYVESDGGTSSFYIDDFELALIPPLTIETEIPSVYQSLVAHFPVGAAIQAGAVPGNAHSQLLTKHFNSVTAENDMKWGPIHPTEATYNYGPADALVNFATANGMQVRGHALVWHEQNPNWLFLDANGNLMTPTPQNKAILLQRLETHIRAVVTHFGSAVNAWDVVNEIIDPNQSDGFRRSMWFQICGTDYIDRAFQVAREVAPNARLYINDFDTTNPTKRAFLLNLVRNLKSRGIPVDGVGHQMHCNIDGPSASAVFDTINMFSAIPGVDNQITEMDVSVYNNGTQRYDVVPSPVLRRQGYRYRDYFNVFRQLQGKISSVTLWGLADDSTWLSNFPIARLEAPLLFDTQLKAKHAYWGIIDPSRLNVSVSGRVTTADGRGLRNAGVALIDPLGVVRSVSTSSFGFYQFDNVEADKQYTLRVTSKRYRFPNRSIQVGDPLSNIDFVAQE